MQNFIRVFFIFFWGLISTGWSYTPKEGNVTANIGPFIYKTNFRGSDSGVQSQILSGTGLLVNGDINDRGALEIGLFHMNKYFFREKDGLYKAENTDLIHITMGYRRFISSLISVSLSLYSSYSLGDPHTSANEFPADQDVDTSARDITEYGFDIAAQYELWSLDRFSIVTDLRYAYSMTNKLNERSDHYGAFISLRYFVQDKEGTYRSEQK
ncbi:MAG: hypothetical protein JNL11_15445 [Bdellovibrionaceae bacterium]|nr:hypothetical protein [Pseudobdellovibrionaceae bacterium]